MFGGRLLLSSLLLGLALLAGVTSCGIEPDCPDELYIAYADVELTFSDFQRDRQALQAARKELVRTLKRCPSVREVEIGRGLIGPEPIFRSRLEIAIATGDVDIIETELQTRLQVESLRESECVDLMLSAAFFADPALMSELVTLGCPIDGRDELDTSPLATSIGGAQKDGENTRWLIDQGASANDRTPTGFSALVAAIAARDTGAVRELLASGADPMAKPPEGDDLIAFADMRGNSAIVEMLRRARKENPC